MYVKFDDGIKGENIEDHEVEKMINDKEEIHGNEEKNVELIEGPGPPDISQETLSQSLVEVE